MENLEDAARSAAERWKDRENAKHELRILILKLSEKHSMTEIAEIVGIRRTTLYYFLYGRDGKTNPAIRTHDKNLRLHAESLDFRKSA